MKKSFIILFSIFIIACADGEIGGYTETIIRNANLVEPDTTTKEEPIALAKAEPIEADLSILDEDELREKLMNTFPKPKALLKSGDITQSNTFELPHNPQTDQIITNISWKEIIPIFEEAPDYHKYGFDRDPYDTSKVVYISVKEPENSNQLTEDIELIDYSVYFKPNFSCMAYEKYKILHEQYQDNPAVVASKGVELSSDKIEHIKYSSLLGNYYLNPNPNKSITYTLFGCYKNCDGKNQKWRDAKKQITIIPYKEKIKNIIYAQIDGNPDNPWNPNNTDCKKGFSKECVTNYFNQVYNQAVVYPNIEEAIKKQPADIYNGYQEKELPVINELIDVDMTTPEKNESTYLVLYAIAIDYIRKYREKNNGYWRFVYAINKEKKTWHLDKCINSLGDLHTCKGFHPEQEHPSTTYFIESPNEECATKNGGIGTEKVKVYIRAKDELEDGKKVRRYYAFRADNNKKAEYARCDILYTDDGYPVIPNTKGIKDGLQALNLPLKGDIKFDKTYYLFDYKIKPFSIKFDQYKDYLSYESFIMVPRSRSNSSLYVLMHELGHSFGLTDVSRTALFQRDDIKDGKFYTNTYASSETNLMSWHTPAGKKLRYRENPIACTGGIGYYDKDDTYLDATELRVDYIEEDGKKTKAKGEKQWDCIRDCYVDNFEYTERINYFNYTGVCADDKSRKKIVENEEEFRNFENEELKDKIFILKAKTW